MQLARANTVPQPAPHLQQRRALLAAYVTFLFIITTAFGLGNLLARDEWTVGDWLINYQAGFVRRGLIGELVFRLGHVLHVSPLFPVLLLQLLCYGVIFYSGFQLLSASRLGAWVLLLAFSPATFAFQVMNQAGGYRKEIVLLAGLGVLLLLLRVGTSDIAVTLFLSFFSVCAVLSHEGLFFFFPYIFAALPIGQANWSRTIRVGVAPLLLACAAFGFALQHPGNEQSVRGVCASLGYPAQRTLPKPCSGAIAMLGKSAAWSRTDTHNIAHTFHYGAVYSATALLALLPVAWGFAALWRDRRTHRDLLTIAAAAALSLGGTIVLLLYTVDWGRWIYIHVVCLFFLLLAVDGRRRSSDLHHAPENGSRASKLSLLTLICLVTYATCWSIPHMGTFQLRAGYLYLLHSQITGR